MAQAAEEYGSHDKTFEIAAQGTVRVVRQSGEALLEFWSTPATSGGCADVAISPIQDWVKLAVGRARATRRDDRVLARRHACPRCAADRQGGAVIWLDHDTSGLDIQIMSPVEATRLSVTRDRVRAF